jgi:hypothetical protein
MEKKNVNIAAVLGFFVLGLFYVTGLSKKGIIAVIGLTIVSYAIQTTVGPTVSLVANIAGAYLGYTWAKEFNASIDSDAEISVD